MYEAEIHSKLRHPNIVSMLGVVFEPSNYGIILEYVTYGSWTSFLSHVAKASGKSLQHHHHFSVKGYANSGTTDQVMLYYLRV